MSNQSALVPDVKIDEPVRVVFIAHHPTSWSATLPVVENMLQDERFDVAVFSLPHFFLMCGSGDNLLDGEEVMHDLLAEQGIPHTRIHSHSINEFSNLLKGMEPHVVFRQTPWDHDLPIALSGTNLTFARLCYIPYGYMSAAIQEKQFNQQFHRQCYQIFWPDSIHQEMSQVYSEIGSRNCTVTGYPKFDAILRGVDERKSIKVDNSFHLVWAPHWSYRDDWLRFGVFWDVADHLYVKAKENENIRITLRPHPVLQELIKTEPDPRLSEFYESWKILPNTAFSDEADYSHLFADSDALVTDGVSFLSEYQLFDKPVLYCERFDNIGFNEAGIKILDGVYKVRHLFELDEKLTAVMDGNEDPQVTQARREIAAAIRPYPGRAATNIVESLYSKLISEVEH